MLTITGPTLGDREDFIAAARASRELHGDWVSPPSTIDDFADYLQRVSQDDFEAFLIRANEGELVGVVNVSNIVLGKFCSAYLGFFAFEPFAGRGLFRAGFQLVLKKAFTDIGLHRVEANIQPKNNRSIGLVRSCGFRREGYSPKYLEINGQWQDHERWALLADEFRDQHDRSGSTDIGDTTTC